MGDTQAYTDNRDHLQNARELEQKKLQLQAKELLETRRGNILKQLKADILTQEEARDKMKKIDKEEEKLNSN